MEPSTRDIAEVAQLSTHDAVAYCAEQVRLHDGDRYATSLFARESDRPALWALYAFNLEIAKTRDVVTQPLIGQMLLQWWRDAIEGIVVGQPRDHPVVSALAGAMRSRSLDPALLEKLIEGREATLDEAPSATMAALVAYAEATSAPLVLLAAQALGGTGPAVAEAARHVGIAWALTGILRSTAANARHRRVMLPGDLLGGSASQLLAANADTGVRHAVSAVAEVARAHLRDARRHSVPRRTRAAMLPATLATGYLNLLRRADYDPFDPRVPAPLPSRAWRLVSAALTGRY